MGDRKGPSFTSDGSIHNFSNACVRTFPFANWDESCEEETPEFHLITKGGFNSARQHAD